jgi:predicted secreted hydrolase
VKEDSAWRTHQLYMGHFAITDTANEHHQGFERFSRGAVGLAGAQAVPFRVWLEDWSLASSNENANDTLFPLRVQAREGEIELDLTLTSAKPLILQGDRGLSQKSSEPGNASYYYSYPRLSTQGSLHLDGREFLVSGSSWLDREWSTSALGPDQAGWDWFALQLDDGRELMFYRLRLKEGGTDPHSSGTLVTTEGEKKPLEHDDVRLEVLDTWISPHSGDRYPIRWRLSVPAEDLELMVTPRVKDQEMSLSVGYWEGAVQAQGHTADRPITGTGYLEMTRYEGSLF